MVAFFTFVMISIVVSEIFSRRSKSDYWDRTRIMIVSVFIGIMLGLVASFLGGSFVKKEVVVEKYFISPMIIDGKPIVALIEEGSLSTIILPIKDGDKTKLIKHNLSKKDIFFGGNERYLEVKRSKTSRRNMWVWFFYGNAGLIESKAVCKDGDNFLTFPEYYSL